MNSLDDLRRLSHLANQLNVSLTEEQCKSIEIYLSALRAYNEHTNLVSNAEPGVVIREHILDSLTLVPVMQEASHLAGQGPGNDKGPIASPGNTLSGSLIDIGSGAGFPALILAIVCPELEVVLVESIGKKARFLAQAVKRLGLDRRVTVVCQRAEELAHNHKYRESFFIATARALGTIDVVVELTLPFLRRGGMLFAQKSSRQLDSEMERLKGALVHIAGRLVDVVKLDQQLLGKEHAVVVVEKESSTPDWLPRMPAQIKKRPLGEELLVSSRLSVGFPEQQ